jgi:hypothetical protein
VDDDAPSVALALASQRPAIARVVVMARAAPGLRCSAAVLTKLDRLARSLDRRFVVFGFVGGMFAQLALFFVT